MTSHPLPVDYSEVVAATMNMSGRFTGREIKNFGQNVLKHILVQKRVGLFIGQQINFKPTLPDGYRFIGTNRAFMCYNTETFKVCDERQYRHFLRDLHIRGQLPHHYLPDTNYVVMKMRYRHRPWTEFIALSWFTDESQTKLKNLGHLRKVMHYVSHLAEAEEMPVIVGGTFRMALDSVKMEMDGDFRCYGYIPSTPRRRMRESNVFFCAKPMKMHAVKPLVCAKLAFEKQNSSMLLNPEDAFYWDPVIGNMLFPIQTPESIEKARQIDINHQHQIQQAAEIISTERPITISTTNMTGISSKHLLINSPSSRMAGLKLPTAPVLPTLQENQSKLGYSPPPPSPIDGIAPVSCSTPNEDPNYLSPIDEVSSEFEHQDSFHSDTDTLTGEITREISEVSQAEQLREQKMFDLLEAMMNDKSSTFFVVNNGTAEPNHEISDLDPIILNLIQSNQLQSIDELKATIKARIQAGACPTSLLPDSIIQILNQDQASLSHGDQVDSITTSACTTSRIVSAGKDDGDGGICHTELETSMLMRMARIPSYQELYDEDLINKNTQCYMS